MRWSDYHRLMVGGLILAVNRKMEWKDMLNFIGYEDLKVKDGKCYACGRKIRELYHYTDEAGKPRVAGIECFKLLAPQIVIEPKWRKNSTGEFAWVWKKDKPWRLVVMRKGPGYIGMVGEGNSPTAIIGWKTYATIQEAKTNLMERLNGYINRRL